MTAPIKRPTYYAVSDLNYDDVDVIVLTPGGEECVAKRNTVWRRRQATTAWRMRIPIREPGRATRFKYADLPDRLEITRWRPLAGFPGPLPKPAHMVADVRWQKPAEPPAPPEQSDDLECPHAYAEAPNISRDEVKVRLLRAPRTDRAAGERGVDVRPGWYKDSVATLARQNLPRLTDEHVDLSHIGPAGEACVPSRRDRSDYLLAMGWYARLPAALRSVVWERSLSPPLSFRSIGDRASKSAEWARKRYRKAIETAWKIANQTAPTLPSR
jgi:hypothetical protein